MIWPLVKRKPAPKGKTKPAPLEERLARIREILAESNERLERMAERRRQREARAP